MRKGTNSDCGIMEDFLDVVIPGVCPMGIQLFEGRKADSRQRQKKRNALGWWKKSPREHA